MLWDVQVGKQDTEAFQEAIFISVWAVAQQIHIQRVSPDIPLQVGYKSKKQGFIYSCMQLYWLLHPPVLRDLLHI
jgi:hypothetical protein